MLSKVDLRTDADALYSEAFWEDDDQIESKSIYWTPGSSRRSSPANHLTLSSNPRRSSRLRVSPGSLSRSSTSEYFLSQLPSDEGSPSVCNPASARRYPTSFQSSSSSRPSTAHNFSTLSFCRNQENLLTRMNPLLGDSHEDNSFVVSKSFTDTIRNPRHRDNTREIAILEFIASTKGLCSFLQGVRIQKSFSDDGYSHIHLENYPTSLANPHVARRFCVTRSIYQGSSDSAIQALRLLAAELCIALLFLHRHGIVHQDVKPANIMIAKDGHIVLGDFGAARVLPIIDNPHSMSVETLKALSERDTKNVTFGNIVLQPDDVVTLTPAYAAPELMERNVEGLLVYDERVDWWGLGLSLYEVLTGRIPSYIKSDLPEDLERILYGESKIIQESNVSLHGFLQLLLVRNPAGRLSGEEATLHPFFDPLRGLWEEIKSLRHPPCPRPPNVSFFGFESFNLQTAPRDPKSERPSLDDNISQTRRPLGDPYPIDCDYNSPGVARGSSLSGTSPTAHNFMNRRKEALEIGRPAARIFEDRTNYLESPASYDSGESMLVQQEAFMSSRFDSPLGHDTPNSSIQPFPSSASIARFFSKGDTKLAPPMELMSEEEYGHCTLILDNSDRSFNDSGLDFPLGESPESWGARKDDEIRKPDRLRLVSTTIEPTLPPRPSQHIVDDQTQHSPARLSLVNFNLPQEQLAEKMDNIWTIDQKIAISLLSAGVTMERQSSERQVKRRFETIHVTRAPGRAIRAMTRRVSNILRCWQPDHLEA